MLRLGLPHPLRGPLRLADSLSPVGASWIAARARAEDSTRCSGVMPVQRSSRYPAGASTCHRERSACT
ncbi:hypothetical protein [Saccharothrix sp.]|uniref:hypothetical protein n=1 Tax=Saccharothrix sp. TaxID=1873460 RepID=UPI002811A64C|nr:hypothetical protein [Saccharothrix sp.]